MEKFINGGGKNFLQSQQRSVSSVTLHPIRLWQRDAAPNPPIATFFCMEKFINGGSKTL